MKNSPSLKEGDLIQIFERISPRHKWRKVCHLAVITHFDTGCGGTISWGTSTAFCYDWTNPGMLAHSNMSAMSRSTNRRFVRLIQLSDKQRCALLKALRWELR